MPQDLRWFSFDAGLGLAVISGMQAFAAFDSGWRPVNSAEVGWDGRAMPERLARAGWRDTLARIGEPPIDPAR